MIMLERVEAAARASEAATARLRAEVVAAKRAGAKPAQLARAAKVTRQTIYRWLSMEGETIPDVRLRERMTDAMLLMASIVRTPSHAGEIYKRATHPQLDVQLRGYKMALAWTDPQLAKELSADDQAVIALGTDALNELTRKQAGIESDPHRARGGIPYTHKENEE